MTAEKSERKAIMEIKLHDIPEQIVHCMRDGKGDTHKQTFEDDYARIMIITLDPGASIGPHTHETNYEIFMASVEPERCCMKARKSRWLPASAITARKGHNHSLVNSGSEPLSVFAIIPKRVG